MFPRHFALKFDVFDRGQVPKNRVKPPPFSPLHAPIWAAKANTRNFDRQLDRPEGKNF